MGGEPYCGFNVSVWLVAASTAPLLNGNANVEPLYHAGHWSINHGLAGFEDSPKTTLSVL
jgi:hypothetical protein